MDHKLAQATKPRAGKHLRRIRVKNALSSEPVKALATLKSGETLEHAYRHAFRNAASGGPVALQIGDLSAIWGARFTADEIEALVIR